MKLYVVFFLLSILHSVAGAEVAIICNPENPIDRLTKTQIKRIFLGKVRRFPNGDKAIPLDLDRKSATRHYFYQHVINKTENQLKSYWSKTIFAGKSRSPKVVASEDTVVDMVAGKKAMIGYIDANNINSQVKVVMRID